jgi:uncharacterized protein involved in exopolysaccharide biosynthesis/beta-lactamase regulating signal transducer with metallopeptidase domain
MTTSWLNHPAIVDLGWMLIHSLWQGAVIALILLLAKTSLKRSSSNSRYLAGTIALLSMVIAPIATVFAFGNSMRPVVTLMEITAGRTGAFPMSPPSNSFEGAAYSWGWLKSFVELFGSAAPWLGLLWLFGVALGATRLVRDLCWIRHVGTHATEPIGSHWVEVMQDLQIRLGISRPVRLLKSALIEVPTLIGWLRPVILLPAASLTGLTPNQLEAILAHELAHVKRCDYLVNSVQCLVEAILFYHPAAWWISRCIREEREICCDDLVLKVCEDRCAYARALASLEQLRPGSPRLAFAATGGSLLRRVRRLAGVPAETAASPIQFAGLFSLLIGLACILVGICSLFTRPTYSARARAKIDLKAPAAVGPLNGTIDNRARYSSSYDPYFLQTETEVIRSDLVLRDVIARMNLAERWRKKYGIQSRSSGELAALLRSKLRIQPVRNTTLIDIIANSDTPEEASELANSTAEAYRDFHHNVQSRQGALQLNALENRLEEQRKKVHQAQDDLDRMRKELSIPAAALTAEGLASLSQEKLRNMEKLRVDTERQLAGEKTILDNLKPLSPEKLVQVIPTAAPDTLLISFLEQLALAEQRLLALRKDYASEHPEIIKAASQLEDLRTKVKERVEGIMLGLQAHVDGLSARRQSLDAEVQKAAQNEDEILQRSRPYFDKKREIEELLRFEQVLALKLTSEQVEQESTRPALIELMDLATPPPSPSTPNRPFATALLALGVLLEILGVGMLRSGYRAVI